LERSVLIEEIRNVQAELAQLEHRRAGLQVRSPEAGHFVSVLGEGLVGHLIPQGDDLGYVLKRDERVLRAVIDERDIGLFVPDSLRIDVRVAESPGASHTGRLLRIVPGAGKELPSAALGTAGGGSVELEPGDDSGRLARSNLYQMEIGIPPVAEEALRIGGRAFVRFRHADRPFVLQLYRRLRQMFFSALAV
jgi:putative peptide zinc metalloprotease protein